MKLPSGFLGRNKKKKKDEYEDLGFGDKITGNVRLINPDGSYNVIRRGLKAWTPYQDLVEMSWGRFFLLVVLFYAGVNAVFALLYLIIGVDNLNGMAPGGVLHNFAEAFFFSVQTFTTVGYGAVNPTGVAANIIAAAGALVGLMSFALATGLFFARFAKPKAQLIFSDNALIAPYRGGDSFQFRIANRRSNKIIDLVAQLSLSWVEDTERGKIRRFARLELERYRVNMLPLNWTLVHPIDQDSPMYGLTDEDLKAMQAEFIIQIEGHDETFAQMVHANSSYLSGDIRWNQRFALMFEPGPQGETIFHLDKLNAFYPEEEE